jgi:hypothetical protein
MGFIKQAKADVMAADAARARKEGRRVFVAQFRGGMFHTGDLSRPVQDVAEMIEGVESAGWRLDKMSSFESPGVGGKGNPTIVALFRPVEAETGVDG